jgi:AcrR family transcriptional regulator
MAGQRREEILNALETCILEKGIQATSLEHLADTAKMKRTILRHYIGNRDAIICALSARWTATYGQQWQDTLGWLPSVNRAEALIDILFSSRSTEHINNTIIGEALFSEAKRLPEIKLDQEKIMAEFVGHLTTELSGQYPNANDEKVELVAVGVYANYLMSESLLPLAMMDEVIKLKKSTLLLITTLI